jgi:hypothetical protein
MTARVLLTILVLVQGAATVLIDLNRTHAGNPGWAGHARFHIVWQTFSTALLSLVIAALIWSNKSDGSRFYVSAALAAVPLLGFVLAQATKGAYGATLHDPNGILPLRLRIGRHILRVDGNAAAVYCAIPVLLFIIALFHHATHAGQP